MKIHALRLLCLDAEEQFDFYVNTLGLSGELLEDEAHIQVGTTKVVFKTNSNLHNSAYHFAMNIPSNKFEEAADWLDERCTLVADNNGEDIFDFKNWNAHSVYAYDPSGNVIELIARHDLKNDVQEKFSSQHLLNVSEIGIATDDVLETANELQEKYKLPLYRQNASDSFTPLGDEEGLFILVKEGREWFPDTDIPAEVLPLEIEFQTAEGSFSLQLF